MELQKCCHFIQVSLTHKKFFLEVMGGPWFEPHSAAVPTCWWELHLGRASFPVQDHSRKNKALPAASTWFPKCWHSLGWGLKITMQRWDGLSYKENESLALSHCFHHAQYLFLGFFPLTQTHIYFQILIQLPVQPMTWAIAALKSINFEWFCFEIEDELY